MQRVVFNKANAVIWQIVAGWICIASMSEVALATNYSLGYSGRLTQESGAAVEGPVDVQVSFWSGLSGGMQRGETLTYLITELNQGVFSLNLDLRPDQVKVIFADGSEAVFVEIAAAGKVYPRQQFLYVPFALRLPTDNTTVAFNDDGRLGFAGASSPAPNSYLSADGTGKLKWVNLEAGALVAKTADNLAPVRGQVLTYNGSKWIAAADGSESIKAESPISVGTSSQYWRGDKTWQTLDTTSVPEGNNQYFSVARAVSSLSSTSPVSYSPVTGNISIVKASGTVDGYLAASDWNVFNNKQDTIGFAPLNKSGDTMSGALNMNSQPIEAVGNVVLSGARTLGLGGFDNSTESLMTVQLDGSGAASPDKGKTWFNTSTNQVKYWDGSRVQALGVSGAGLTSFNGQDGSSQTFQVNSVGDSPSINSGSGTHTLSIPEARVAGVTGGVISNADYASFLNKVGSVIGGSGISVANAGGTATVSLVDAGSPGTFSKVTTNAQGQVTSGSILASADIPDLDANKIISGQLAAANGGTGISSTATFPASGVIVTEGAPETLTNKTLTAATINGASSISGSTSIATTGAISSGAVTVDGNITLQGSGTNARRLILSDASNSKYLSLQAPDTIVTSTTWSLPSADGGNGQVLATNGSGALGWASGLAPIGAASGDLEGDFPSPTVAKVGGVNAANLATGAASANAATDANTGATIVKRDASGNFNAGTISGSLIGNVTGNLAGNASTATSANSFTGFLTGDVTGTQATTVVGTVGGVSAVDLAAGANLANAATNTSTASTIVRRDGSGGFVAGTITANLTGTASNATSAGSFTGSLAGDVTGTQGATVVSLIGTSSATSVHAAELATNAASSSNSALAIVKRDSNGGFSSGQVNARAPNAASQGLVVRGSASQSASLQEWQDSAGSVLAAMSSSGYLQLKDSDGADNFMSLRASPSMTANLTYTLPGTVSAGSYLTTDGSGNMSWNAPGSFSGSLAGDVTGTQSATIVASVGGVTASNVAASSNLASAATNGNTVSTIVKRDASGNFSAGVITANLIGTASTATSATSFSGSLGGDVTGTQAATIVANVGGVAAANIATGVNLAIASTTLNSASTIVRRDAVGGFAAGNITANLTGNVAGNVSGTSSNVTGTVAVANGGTGASILAANSVLLGNGVSSPLTVAPGANGNILMSNGSTWTSSASTTSWASPGAIGATSPSSAVFTSLAVSGNIGVGVTSPHTAVQIAGPVATAVSIKTSAFTISSIESVVVADASTAAFNITLPSAVGIAGRQYMVKKRDSSANAVTLGTTSGQTIDGSSQFVLGSQWQFLTIISDGANWIIAATNVAGVPSGSVAYFNTSACPGGWAELTSSRGRVIVGLGAGGTLAGTVGTQLSNLSTRDINSVPAHTHAVSPPVTTSSNGGAHVHSVDPPITSTSNTEGAHLHSVDPPNTYTSWGGDHSHAILAGPGDDLNFSGNYDGVTDSDSYAAVWRNTNVAGGHNHTLDIAAFNSSTAGAHGHTVDVAAFNSVTAGAHDHTVTIPNFTSGSTGSATVDVTMPYLQLLVCQKS